MLCYFTINFKTLLPELVFTLAKYMPLASDEVSNLNSVPWLGILHTSAPDAEYIATLVIASLLDFMESMPFTGFGYKMSDTAAIS